MTYKATEIIQFVKKPHGYIHKPTGLPTHGVTSILRVINKPALVQWAANMASEYWRSEFGDKGAVWSPEVIDQVFKEAKTAHKTAAQKAADIGTEIHDYADAYFKGKDLPKLSGSQAENGAKAFRTLIKDYHVEVEESERIVFSESKWFSGTCDFVGRINGERCVADWKSGSALYPEARLQLAAYQMALEEEGQKFDCRYGIRFDKTTGIPSVHKLFPSDYPRDRKGFLAALDLHLTLKSIEEDNS